MDSVVSIFTCESLSLLCTFIINFVVVTVHFLISLLFPVYYYLSLWTLPFVPPFGRKRGEASHVFYFVGVLDWRISFLNHDNHWKKICKCIALPAVSGIWFKRQCNHSTWVSLTPVSQVLTGFSFPKAFSSLELLFCQLYQMHFPYVFKVQ